MQKYNVKAMMTTIYEKIIRELSFEHMIERGMKDVRKGHVISSQEMDRRIRTWQK